MSSPYIVFVDPLSSTEFLVETLKKSGIPIIVVYTVANVGEGFIHLFPEIFDRAFFAKNDVDLQHVMAELKKLPIFAVYAGSETTLQISDRLARELAPQSANDPNTSIIRCSKYEMQEALKSAGVRSVKQMKVIKALSAEQMQELISSWTFPVIIKPSNSAGSAGVCLCHDLDQIEAYLEQNHKNFIGQDIPYFVIQDYLQGTEFLVDSFSINGKHHISTIQYYTKILYNNNPLYLYADVVSEDDPTFSVIAEYAKEVLTALGVEHGFGHTEIMLTAAGPCLIELNPRISGAYGMVGKMAHMSGGISQIDLLVAFYQGRAMPQGNSRIPTRGVLLQNYQTRTMSEINKPLLATLESFKELKTLVKAGTPISPPQSFLDVLGWVIISHLNKEQLWRDHVKILVWEQQEKLF